MTPRDRIRRLPTPVGAAGWRLGARLASWALPILTLACALAGVAARAQTPNAVQARPSIATVASPTEPANPYRLIRESEFERRFDGEIVPHWERHVKRGRLQAADGVSIAYVAAEVVDEAGAIVIVSGRTESFVKYQELVYDLNRQRYSVFIHDHRGQGFSDRLLADDRHKGHVADFDDYVRDLDTFVRRVVLATPGRKPLLLAHSMGGGIATRYIQQHPDVFRAAALSSPMHAPNAKILVSAEAGCWWFRLMDWLCRDCYAGFAAKPWVATPFEANDLTHSPVRYARLMRAYSANTEVQLGGPTRGWAGQACAAGAKAVAQADRVRIPVLVLQAGADTAVMPDAQDAFCSRLASEPGRGCVGGRPLRFEGAWHELLIEADRWRIPAIGAILDFFASVR